MNNFQKDEAAIRITCAIQLLQEFAPMVNYGRVTNAALHEVLNYQLARHNLKTGLALYLQAKEKTK